MEIHDIFPNAIQNHEKNENFKNRRIFDGSNFDKVLVCQRVLEYHKNWKSLIQKTFFQKLNFSSKDPSHFWFFGTVLGPKSNISCTKILEYWFFPKNVRLWNAITFSDLNIFFGFFDFWKALDLYFRLLSFKNAYRTGKTVSRAWQKSKFSKISINSPTHTSKWALILSRNQKNPGFPRTHFSPPSPDAMLSLGTRLQNKDCHFQ